MRAKKVFEGIGDKYAAKKWNIPDQGVEFQKLYQAKLLRDNTENKIVYTFNKGSMIIKNPPSLDNFAYNVRAIITKKGDLYVQSHHLETHNDMIEVLAKKGEIKMVEYWWKVEPSEFLTISRVKKTNTFILGESNDFFYTNKYKNEYKKEVSLSYKKIMQAAKEKNPQYEFILKTS